MSYFAEVDENNIVTRVIAISQENVNTGNWGNPATWVQTCILYEIRFLKILQTHRKF